MLDIQILRTQLNALSQSLARRGGNINWQEFSNLEAARKVAQTRTQDLQSERNRLSREFGRLKAKGEDAEPLRLQVQSLAEELTTATAQQDSLLAEQRKWVAHLPNVPHESVPEGKSAEDNQEIHRWGTPAQFSFPALDHVTLGEKLAGMNFEAATRLSGSRFVVLTGQVARLHRALAQFMLNLHVDQHGYEEVQVPLLVKTETMFGTGQLPKFQGEFFDVSEDQLLLIPTSESPVTNLVAGQMLASASLPRRWVCHSPCFRREAGSYGKDTRGMIRQHQFDKVELVQVVKPEESGHALEALTRHAEIVLEKLELPYRRMLLCTGDMGFSAAKTYDLEVWLPGSGAYREISSCSNCTDFQARRMMARFKNEAGKVELVHTLNGSALAVGRTLVAVLENGQQADGRVRIPQALRPLMEGQEFLLPA